MTKKTDVKFICCSVYHHELTGNISDVIQHLQDLQRVYSQDNLELRIESDEKCLPHSFILYGIKE